MCLTFNIPSAIITNKSSTKANRKLYKPSIKDSQRWFIISAENLPQAVSEVEKIKGICEEQKIKL